MGKSFEERFWDKVKIPENEAECWEWVASKTSTGYGKIYKEGKVVVAHRESYEMFKEEIPEGLVIDHLCRNRGCVNPRHLEAVTQKENVLRGQGVSSKHARKTHCPQGHEYTPENTMLYKGSRYCKECRKINLRRYYANRKTDVG